MHTTQSAPSILLHPTPRSALADETIADLTNEALFEAAASPALPPPASPARNITAGHARNFVYPYHLSEHSTALVSCIEHAPRKQRASERLCGAVALPLVEARWSNGDAYKGEWRWHRKDVTWNTTRIVRHASRPHGKGEYIYSNGDLYDGHWRDGLRHGTGTLRMRNGDQYSGHFKADMFHGVGTYTFANGGIARSHWQNGKQHGQSRYIFSGRAQANSTVPVRSNQRRIVQPLVPARSCFDAKFGDCIASFVEGKPTGMRRGNVPSGLAEYQYKRWQFCPGRSSDGHL